MRKVVIRLVVALVVLAVVLVAADRIAVAYAQREVAQRLQTSYDLSNRPSVKVEGFPFLTQVAMGHYDDIRVHTGGLTARGVPIEELHVRLLGVEAPLRELLSNQRSAMRAASAEATAVVPLAQIRERVPEGITLDAQGKMLRLSGQASLLGRSVPVSVMANVSVDEGDVLVTATRVSMNGNPVDGAVGERLEERYSFTISLGDLPAGLRPTGVAVTTEGLRITATARDVLLTPA